MTINHYLGSMRNARETFGWVGESRPLSLSLFSISYLTVKLARLEMRLFLEPSLCKVVLTRLRNKKRPPPLTIVDHKEPGEESSFEQVDHYHLDHQLLLGLGDLRLASLPSPPVVVHERGFLSMALSHGVTVDLTPRQALRVSNPVQASSIAISSCGRQLAFLHPTGWHFPLPRQFFLTQMFRENAAIWTQNRTTGMRQRCTSNRNEPLFNR